MTRSKRGRGETNVRSGEPNVRPGEPDVRPGEPDVRPGEPDVRPGERRFHHALQNLRRPPTHPQPISIEPSNPLEAILIERLRQLEADIQELKTRVNWLILAIVGACLTFILKTLFA